MEETELMEWMHFYYLACERMKELSNNAQNEIKKNNRVSSFTKLKKIDMDNLFKLNLKKFHICNKISIIMCSK